MKILFFAQKSHLANIGGPQGYLYNICQYLEKNPSDEIFFLPEENFKRSILDIVIFGFFHLLHLIIPKQGTLRMYLTMITFGLKRHLTKKEKNFYNSFDYIHVHNPNYVLSYFYPGSGVSSKIIVTSHSPEPLADELCERFAPGYIKKHPKIRQYFLQKEVKAYDIANKIMFPVKEAREPYELLSTIHKETFKRNEHKFFYVPTALCQTDMISQNDHILERYAIDAKELKLCYVGRHTTVKGYDFLKESAAAVWQALPNAHYIIGGTESPLTGVQDKRWHEMGWVNTPSLLNEVDAFILPNRNTYFDLILLEILRQGTPVILSRTGGNKWFENKGLRGLLFFNAGDTAQLVQQINRIDNFKKTGQLNDIKKEIREFFQREFSMEKYIERYLTTLNNFGTSEI